MLRPVGVIPSLSPSIALCGIILSDPDQPLLSVASVKGENIKDTAVDKMPHKSIFLSVDFIKRVL